MSLEKRVVSVMVEQLDCFGDFSMSDPICARQCVLRIRCAIEQEQNIRMEMFSEYVAEDGMLITVQ
ncbi:MAG: hypothetical protein HKP58_11175 [Desulfatitalea sp.]|nr:hypothetical protein [Desulfatitalea sp.]NNK00963.1 hypothetical protein [Desulfatitalea sp.]